MRVLSLWLPNLATDRARGSDKAGPIATFVSERGALRLAAVCPAAASAGLRVGMMLTDARAMVPDLAVQPAAPEAEAELLDRIASWCERYTPHVAIDRSHGHGGALWLDITGCAHLFGGETALRRDLLARLAKRGLAARAAIADTPGAAWALARFGQGSDEGAISQPGGSKTALGPLPVGALRLAPEQAAMLERLGLARIESLYPLPRQALVARFGATLTARLDQALGVAREPISWRAPLPAHRAEQAFAEPLLQADALLPLARKLLQQLCCGLEAASAGARRLVLAFYRVDNSTASVAIGTSSPCRDPRQLARLFAEKLDQVDPGFGIERAILEARVVEPLLPQPLAWRAMGAGDLDQARDLAPLVDRLSNRLGSEAVVQLVPRASHIPERAQARVALSQGQPAALCAQDTAPPPHPPTDVPWRTGGARPAADPTLGASGRAARGRTGKDPSGGREAAWAGAGSMLAEHAPTRPLRLLAWPEPIEAVAPLPDDPPVLFRWRRALHKVTRVRGPERLAPEWWREPDADPDAATRDYFAVEDTQGGRFWLFREGLYLAGAAMPRWFLHGLFA